MDFMDAAAYIMYGVDTKAERRKRDERRARRLGNAASNPALHLPETTYWNKVKMSYDKDSGTYQTDNYIGIVGDTGQKSKAHIAINPDGEVVFVRDVGGEVLYDKKNDVGYLPDDLDWSK